MALDQHRFAHRALQALGHELGVERAEAHLAAVAGAPGRRAVDHDDELVAAEAGELVADAHHRAEPLGDVAQQLVADGVAEAVVDDLEVVEVDEQHGDLVGPGGLEQLVEAGDHRRPVGEPGERVVGRGVGEPGGGEAGLGDVLDVGDREGDPLLLGDRHLGLRPDVLAVAAQVALLDAVAVVDAELDARPLGGGGAQVVGVGDLADRAPEQEAARVVEHVGERLVRVDDAVVGQPHQRHAGRRRVERLLEAAPGGLERAARALAVGDVAQHHDPLAAVDGLAEALGTVDRRLDEVRAAVGVDELEHGGVAQVAHRPVGLGAPLLVGVGALPSVGDVALVVVGDEPDERAPEQVVDRATGERRGARVGRRDAPVVVEAEHRVGEVVEEAAHVGVVRGERAERRLEAAADVARLEPGEHDRGERHRADRGDGEHGVGRRVGRGAHDDERHQRRRDGDHREHQPRSATVVDPCARHRAER